MASGNMIAPGALRFPDEPVDVYAPGLSDRVGEAFDFRREDNVVTAEIRLDKDVTVAGSAYSIEVTEHTISEGLVLMDGKITGVTIVPKPPAWPNESLDS